MKTLIFMTATSALLTLWAAEARAAEEEVATSSTSAVTSSVAGALQQPEIAAEVAPAPAVIPPEEKTGEAAPVEAKPAETAVAISGQALPPTSGRPYYARGSVGFRMLAISDEDPANDRSMSYGLEIGYRINPSISVFARSGLAQRFVVPSGDDRLNSSPILLRDSLIGGIYRHSMEVAAKTLSFAHYASVIFPTSLASQRQSMYFAPDLSSRARYALTDDLSVGVDLGFQYRFMKYAELYGPGGALNTQFQLGTGLAVDYSVFDFGEDWGRLDAGAGVSWSWDNTYNSAQGPDHWRQDYGWDLYAFYAPRRWLNAGLSLSEGQPAVLYGRDNFSLFNRDRVVLSFSVQATY